MSTLYDKSNILQKKVYQIRLFYAILKITKVNFLFMINIIFKFLY